MPTETYYEILEVNENASQDMIEFAYQRLLQEAKDRLQDSPMFEKRKQRLSDAYRVLSRPSLRHSYNNKLARERAKVHYESSSSVDWADFISGILFSRGFIGAVLLAVVVIILLPSGRDIMNANVMNNYMQYSQEIQKQQMEMQRARMESMDNYERVMRMGSQNRNSDYYREMQEQAEIRRLEREARYEEQRELNEYQREQYRQRQQARQKEREEQRLRRQQEYAKRDENYRKLREQRIAQQRSREFIEQTERATWAQQELNTLKANEYR